MTTRIAILFLSILLLASCDKKLNEKSITENDITVNWYRISEISTIHDFVEVKRWGHLKRIMESNVDGIYDILIKGDSIIIRTKRDLVIYELTAKALNCNIRLDTTVTTFDYLKKYRPESAEAFKNEAATIDTSAAAKKP